MTGPGSGPGAWALVAILAFCLIATSPAISGASPSSVALSQTRAAESGRGSGGVALVQALAPKSVRSSAPWISVAPLSGPVGTPLNYSGGGWGTGVQVQVVGPKGQAACQGTPDTHGEFVCQSTIPSLPQGGYQISATNGSGTATFDSLTIIPDLLPVPAWGPVGANLTFTGFGWRANDSVTVNYNGSTACLVTATTVGSFECPTITVPPSGIGAVVVSANDNAAGGGLQATSTFTVVSTEPLTVSSPTATPSQLDLGGTLVLSANAAGGSGGYAYDWMGLPTGCASTGSPVLSCTPAQAGSWTVRLNVSDSLGDWIVSPPVSVQVATDPFVGSLEASRLSVDVGEEENLTVAASGGVTPYRYLWLGLPSGCAGGTASISCEPTASGSFTVSVVLTDATGVSVSSSGLFLVVDPPLSTGGVQATAPGADVDGSVTFYVEATGGTGSNVYFWAGLPDGCASSDTPSVNCVPADSGHFIVGAEVQDSNGVTIRAAALSFEVFPEFFAVGYPTESRITLDLGQSVNFSETAVGGWQPYFYNWSDMPIGCQNRDLRNVTCTPTATGTWWVSVEVTDQTGAWFDTDAVQLIVSPTLSRPSLVAEPGSLAVGQSLTLGVTVSGGTGLYTFYWSGLPPGCTPLDESTIDCAPTTAGTYQTTVMVLDTNGATSSTSTSVVVTGAVALSSTAVPWTTIAEVIGAIIVLVAALWALPRMRTSVSAGRSSGRVRSDSKETEESEVGRFQPHRSRRGRSASSDSSATSEPSSSTTPPASKE